MLTYLFLGLVKVRVLGHRELVRPQLVQRRRRDRRRADLEGISIPLVKVLEDSVKVGDGFCCEGRQLAIGARQLRVK